MSESLTLMPRGPFSLRAAAEFGFGPTQTRPPRLPPFDGAMRLAFPLDGARGYAGVIARQRDADGPIECQVHLVAAGGGDLALIERQLARVLSHDHDGDAFLAVGARDGVLGELQRRHPGQRPVLFHSPYEAAAWAIISARRRAAQAAAVRRALALRLGARFELAGAEEGAFPQPERLLDAGEGDGLSAEKVRCLHGVARAALEGALDPDRLHALGPEAAWAAVRDLRGIGPFYAGLVVLRAVGFADAGLLIAEPRVFAHAARFYGLDRPPTLAAFHDMAQAWRPYRTWATVLIRLAGDRQFGR